MASALSCNGSRVLTPTEAEAIRAHISKPSARHLFDMLLYSGLRFSEARQIAEEPARFDEERGQLAIRSTKPQARYAGRNVILGDRGRDAVRRWLDSGAKMPRSVTSWQMNLIRWAEAAGLSPMPGAVAASNPTGITARTSRKTWESWLLASCPAEITRITLSQGHSETVALRHYLNISWTAPEIEAIRHEVAGWCR